MDVPFPLLLPPSPSVKEMVTDGEKMIEEDEVGDEENPKIEEAAPEDPEMVDAAPDEEEPVSVGETPQGPLVEGETPQGPLVEGETPQEPLVEGETPHEEEPPDSEPMPMTQTVEGMVIPSAGTAPVLTEPFPSDPLPLKPAVRDVQVSVSDCATPTWLVPPKFTSPLHTFMTCENKVVFEIPALIPPEVLRVLAEQKTTLPLRDGNNVKVMFSKKNIKIGLRHIIKMDTYDNGTYTCTTSPDVSKKNLGAVTRNRRRLEERRRR
jgi:hypothetical protein